MNDFEYKPTRKKRTYRIILVAWFCFNISFTYATNPSVQSFLLNPNYSSRYDLYNFNFGPFILTFLALVIVVMILALFLFIPIWFIEDSEIYSFKAKSQLKVQEYSNIGNFYNNLLRGFIGFGLISSYVTYFIYVLDFSKFDTQWLNIFISLLFPIWPLLMTTPIIIGQYYIEDVLLKKRTKFLNKLSKKEYYKEDLFKAIQNIE
ncbi:MAG: hypothetical protein ACFFC3_00955 [Candidatus Odinarchaeota archaeon]